MIRSLSIVAGIVGTAFLTSVSHGQSTEDLQLARSTRVVHQPRPDASNASDDAANLPAPTVTLLDPGDEPRQELRYAFKKGTSRTVSAAQTIQVHMRAGDKDLPSMPTLSAKVVVGSKVASAGGNLASIVRKILSADVDLNASDATKTRFKKMLDELRAFRSTVQVNTKGIVRRIDTDTQGIEDPRVRKVLESMKEAMARTITPLPAEAIGIGGKWQVISSLEQAGMTFTQRATYSITKLTGRDMQLDIQMDISVPPGKTKLPGFPDMFELVELAGKGNGGSLVEFSGFVSQCNLDSEISIKMKGPAIPGQANQMLELNMSTSLLMQPEQ